MKRFVLFTGEKYYPLPGWLDFEDEFDILDDAVQTGEACLGSPNYESWWQVLDMDTRQIVEGQGYIDEDEEEGY